MDNTLYIKIMIWTFSVLGVISLCHGVYALIIKDPFRFIGSIGMAALLFRATHKLVKEL